MTGTGYRATWHTFEAPYSLTALSGARSLIAHGNEVHLTFNPITGQVVNLLPANRAGRGLMNKAGGVQTNRNGVVNIQVEVIGYARNPWTDDLTPAGRATLNRIVSWMDSLGIPRVSPAGPSPKTSKGPFPRSTAAWSKSGHFDHAQIPENFHWDHGGAEWDVILGGKAVVARPAVKPTSTKSRPAPGPALPFPLPSGSYFGPKDGPAASVSGYFSHATDLLRFQQQLARRGWTITADGRYGDQTYRVTKSFQYQQKLGRDGLIGYSTWQAAFRNPM